MPETVDKKYQPYDHIGISACDGAAGKKTNITKIMLVLLAFEEIIDRNTQKKKAAIMLPNTLG